MEQGLLTRINQLQAEADKMSPNLKSIDRYVSTRSQGLSPVADSSLWQSRRIREPFQAD